MFRRLGAALGLGGLVFTLASPRSLPVGAADFSAKKTAQIEISGDARVLEVDALGQRALLGTGLGKPGAALHLIERESGKTLWSLAAYRMRSCQFCQKGRLLFVATPEGWTLWDTLTHKALAQVRVASSAAGVSPDGKLVIVSHNNQVRTYDGKGKLTDTFSGGASRFEELRVSRNNQFLLSRPNDYYVFDLNLRAPLAEGSGYVDFVPTSPLLLRQAAGFLTSVALESGAVVQTAETHTSGAVECSADGKLALTQGADGTGIEVSQVWRLPQLEKAGSRNLTPHSQSRFCQEPRSVVSWEPGGQAVVWDGETGKEVVAPFVAGSALRQVRAGRGWLVAIGGGGNRSTFTSWTWPAKPLSGDASSGDEPGERPTPTETPTVAPSPQPRPQSTPRPSLPRVTPPAPGRKKVDPSKLLGNPSQGTPINSQGEPVKP